MASGPQLLQKQPLRTGRAWQMTGLGKPSDIELLQLVDRRVPMMLQPGQLLVKVASAALNPIDAKICEGKISAGTFPLHVGFDFAGEVVEASPESGFMPGQEVFGDAPNDKASNLAGGSLSEYVLVHKSQVALKPKKLSFVEASSLPLVGMTVLDCLTKASLPEGARVLILGASGGVGTCAVQISKAHGYHVIGVCSGRNLDLVLNLGADEVVDYQKHDWSLHLRSGKVDAVFDFAPSGPASAEAWGKATAVMKRGGHFVTISGPDAEGRITPCSGARLLCQMLCRNCCSGFKYHLVLKKTEAVKLKMLAKLVQSGKLKPVIAKVYSFTEAPAAFAHLMSCRAVGKICVTVPR